MENKLDIKQEARRIIKEHTEGFMNGTQYKPEDEDELWETMLSECAFILTEDFLDGKYTPMQYNDIRNEVAEILTRIFTPASYEDMKKSLEDHPVMDDIDLKKRMYDIDKAERGCGYWAVCADHCCPCPVRHYSCDDFDIGVWDRMLHRPAI